jgi:hypothetical protein
MSAAPVTKSSEVSSAALDDAIESHVEETLAKGATPAHKQILEGLTILVPPVKQARAAMESYERESNDKNPLSKSQLKKMKKKAKDLAPPAVSPKQSEKGGDPTENLLAALLGEVKGLGDAIRKTNVTMDTIAASFRALDKKTTDTSTEVIQALNSLATAHARHQVELSALEKEFRGSRRGDPSRDDKKTEPARGDTPVGVSEISGTVSQIASSSKPEREPPLPEQIVKTRPAKKGRVFV